jgi:mRNA interferase MazF
MTIRRGDLFWIDDAKLVESLDVAIPSRAHPHVVVSDDVFNMSRVATIIVCALTTNIQRASEPGNVLLSVGEGSLEKQSVIVVSQIASIAKSALGMYIGTLASTRVDHVLDGLRFQQASFLLGR